MDDFSEEILPHGYGYQTEHGRGYSTRMFSLDSGWTHPKARWAAPLNRYTVNYQNRSFTEMDQIRAFYYNHYGSAKGFRLKDKLDFSSAANHRGTPTMLDQTILLTGGVYRLAKTYDIAGTVVVKPIYKPILGTVLISDVGVNVTGSVTVNYETGVLTGYTPTGAYKAGFLFHTPVRFNGEQLIVSIDDHENASIESLELIELRLT